MQPAPVLEIGQTMLGSLFQTVTTSLDIVPDLGSTVVNSVTHSPGLALVVVTDFIAGTLIDIGSSGLL